MTGRPGPVRCECRIPFTAGRTLVTPQGVVPVRKAVVWMAVSAKYSIPRVSTRPHHQSKVDPLLGHTVGDCGSAGRGQPFAEESSHADLQDRRPGPSDLKSQARSLFGLRFAEGKRGRKRLGAVRPVLIQARHGRHPAMPRSRLRARSGRRRSGRGEGAVSGGRRERGQLTRTSGDFGEMLALLYPVI